jgi:hypothetical protein
MIRIFLIKATKNAALAEALELSYFSLLQYTIAKLALIRSDNIIANIVENIDNFLFLSIISLHFLIII